MSLVLTTTLIIVVASWASAQSRGKSLEGDPDTVVLENANSRVVIESNRSRYVFRRGFAGGIETDKHFLYDSWNVGKTKDVWFLLDPHKVDSGWKRIAFDE